MALNLILAQFNSGSLKDQVINSLSQKNHLTAKEIYSQISKNKSVSYQAVHKALNELEKIHILEKNDRHYSISKDWVDSSIKALNQLKARNLSKTKQLKVDLTTNKPQVFKFTSYSTMCVSMAELMRDRALIDKEEKNHSCVLEYGWFPFKFKFTDFFTLMEVVKNNPNCINIVRKKTPLGEWIHKQYLRINALSAPIGTKIDITEDLYICGEYIVEIKFSDESKKIIEYYYNKLKNLEDVFKEFALKKEPEMDITITITKNPQLASFLNQKLIDVYNKTTKNKK